MHIGELPQGFTAVDPWIRQCMLIDRWHLLVRMVCMSTASCHALGITLGSLQNRTSANMLVTQQKKRCRPEMRRQGKFALMRGLLVSMGVQLCGSPVS